MRNGSNVKEIGDVRFDVAPIQIGVAVAESLTDDLLLFYETVVALILKSNYCVYAGSSERDIRSVTTAMLDARASASYAEMTDALAETEPDVQAIVVDLTNPGVGYGPDSVDLRGGAFLGIANAIRDYIDQKNPAPHLIILMRDAMPDTDRFSLVLSAYVEGGGLTVVSDDGTLRTNADTRIEWDPARYRTWLAQLRRDPIERLKLKLVRMLGWFEVGPTDASTYFARQYCDASLCSDEVAELLEQYLERDLRTPIQNVVVQSAHSQWLRDAVDSLANSYKFDVLSEQDLEEYSDWDGVRDSLIVVPVVSDGGRVERVAEVIREKNNQVRVHAFALLSTRGTYERTARVTIGGRHKTSVYYCLKLLQERVRKDEPHCLPVIWGLRPSSKSFKTTSAFTPYQFWDLVAWAGLEAERNAPDFRSPQRLVPNWSKILTEYGTWIAVMMWNGVRERESLAENDVMFVCPEGEHNSRVLAERLRYALGLNVLSIPRDAFREAADLLAAGRDSSSVREALEHNWPPERHRWIRELKRRRIFKVVVFDDISVSGSTLDALTSISELYGFDVIAQTVLVSLRNDRQLEDGRLRSLYWLPGLPASEDSEIAIG